MIVWETYINYLISLSVSPVCTSTFSKAVFIVLVTVHTRPQKQLEKYPFLSQGFSQPFFIYAVQIFSSSKYSKLLSDWTTQIQWFLLCRIVYFDFLCKHQMSMTKVLWKPLFSPYTWRHHTCVLIILEIKTQK